MIDSDLNNSPPLVTETILSKTLRNLPPAYFALVMATGIIAIACRLNGWEPLAWVLFGISLIAYTVLWGFTVGRAVLFPRVMLADLCSHSVAPGFFTTVAATSLIGSQFIVIGHSPKLAWGLWCFTVLLAVTLTYPIFTLLIVKEVKPTLETGLNGGWLVSVVAWQSVCVLGGLLAPLLPQHGQLILFVSLMTWLFGGMLYVWIISLIFYRYMFFEFHPQDLAPPYWIIVDGMLCFVGLLLVLQLWLLTATMESYLGGDFAIVWPAALVSLGCLGLNVGLLYYLHRLDRGFSSI